MPDLIIFDCDGVLVDSESLCLTVLTRLAQAQGADLDAETALSRFRGRQLDKCVADIERDLGHPLPPDFIQTYRDESAEVMRRELKAVEGIAAALDQIVTPSCVASNGPLAKIRLTLGITGLLPRFEGRLFSAYEIGSWKPEPGLFLTAAGTLGVSPAACVVVEDSPTGVRAAIAAGMRVIGFSGGEEERHSELSAAGAIVIDRMAMLPQALAMA